jgi:hypothetical protein
MAPKHPFYRIEANRVPRKYRGASPLKVTRKSSLKLRKAVERFAVYFRREFGYGITEFHAREKTQYTAYLFRESGDGGAYAWVGACCFRPESYSHSIEDETLRWVWIHPFERGRGVLAEAWATLRANHGDFFVEPPVSSSMLNFLLKHNRDSQFYTFYRKLEESFAPYQDEESGLALVNLAA